MENKQTALRELALIAKKTGFYEGLEDFKYESQLKEVINLIFDYWDFRLFIEELWSSDQYCWTYYIFGLVIKYLKKCHSEWNKKEIENILGYLNTLAVSANESVLDLLLVWCLETFDIHSEILSDLIKIMPKDLKVLFLQYYSHYLD